MSNLTSIEKKKGREKEFPDVRAHLSRHGRVPVFERKFDDLFLRSSLSYVNAEPKVLCTTYLIPLEARIQIT